MTSSETLLQDIRTFVREESAALRDRFEKIWRMPLHERVQEGKCLADLQYIGPDSGCAKFLCKKENDSDLREGDLVRISLGDPLFTSTQGNVFRVEDNFVWLQTNSSGFDADPASSWVLDLSYLDLSDSIYRALDEVALTKRGREKILPILSGDLESSVDLERYSEATDGIPEETANDSQRDAIGQGVAASLFHLIQGPPGTGKTYVLAEIVRQKIDAGERILVTGPTHRAIHHALNQIRKIVPENIRVVKIGRPIHDPSLQVPQYESFTDSDLEDADCYVVGATPYTARGRLGGVEFDTVLIDEASQMTLPLAVMAMLSADKYLFIGDHKQLPPVVQTLPPNEAADASIFHHLNGRGYTSLLTQTYRMSQSLTGWPSENFYGGALQAAPGNADRRLALPNPLRDFQDVLDPAHPLVLIEMEHADSLRRCTAEATTVVGLLVHLHLAGLSLENVAVVVPFRSQARRIRSFLEKRPELQNQDWQHCLIDTVERIQGQEREVVLISMTASEPDYLRKMAEFLLLPHRLNVAVTRARSKVILLASRQLCKIPADTPAICEFVAIWHSLRKSCHVIEL